MFAHGSKLKWLWCTEPGVGPNHVSAFKSSLLSPPQIDPLYSVDKSIGALVFTGRPTGVTGLVAIDQAIDIVSSLWEE